MSDQQQAIAGLEDKSLVLLDDDGVLLTRLGQALNALGFAVTMVDNVADATALVQKRPPAFAVLDLRLLDGSGLAVVDALRTARPDSRIVMLTGYGNIATAVAAVKAGAINYLAKPADAEEIVTALLELDPESNEAPSEHLMTPDRVRWEHIQRTFEQCDHNVSETARRLGMHRRTLQRILAKRPPR